MKKSKIVETGFLPAFLLLLACMLVLPNWGGAQDDEEQVMHKARLKTSFLKKSEGNREINAALYARIDRKLVYLPGQELELYVENDTIRELLATKATDEDGKAVFFLPTDVLQYADSSGTLTYLVEFAGSDTLKSTDSDLTIQDAGLAMDLEMDEDSLKTVTVRAVSPEITEEYDPFEYITVKLYVKRLFGNLKIGEAEFAGGEASFEFPDDIPGGTTGMITLLARVEDTDEFGTVQVSQESDWGVVIVPDQAEASFTSPFWRIAAIVLIFILPAVILLRFIIMYFRKGSSMAAAGGH